MEAAKAILEHGETVAEIHKDAPTYRRLAKAFKI
jgi:hypothetical protein